MTVNALASVDVQQVAHDRGGEPVQAFLAEYSLEITPRQSDRVAEIAARLAPGTKVYVALIDPAEAPQQVVAAKALAAHGLAPVPHMPARQIRNAADLGERLARLTGEAGVTQALALGGGLPEPFGEFSSAIELLRTGLFEDHGITRIGFAGHPEGNTDITKVHGEGALMAALREKQAYAREAGLEAYLATQFLFEPGPVVNWARTLRSQGITLPVHVGIPGPATVKTLVKFAAMCGVGASARVIRKQAMNVTKLLTVSTPDDLVSALARASRDEPELDIRQAHFYPFGGFDKLFSWLDTVKR